MISTIKKLIEGLLLLFFSLFDRYLKKVLQFAENFKSQTSSTRNRWEEADKLCYSLATLAEQSPVASFVIVELK